ncbi:MAG: UDP-N-acetylmuramate dehydrogenase [Patescibacteria group bacterium]|nr:UDP-N-acetylmuramate dehydrogenase [Patescibacteria group bacterium]MDE2015451.1 UDP-N-acetylmuramate dehydrogenase [Patescibacteria group bacterium]MDE2226933.1 UDP-N-acetylmuramate dehydrogenase [Patescibacteria group bacterium]
MPKFQENVSLAGFSNYKIGGPAKFFFEAKNQQDVAWAVGEAKKLGERVFILGGGTNLLISDDGFNGLVLKPSLNFIEADGEMLMAGAGVLMFELLDFSVAKGLSGLEWAGGLPGTLGGAIRGNAGAFGREIKENIIQVESIDTNNAERHTRNNQECGFGYRNSIFKELNGGEVILSAFLKMEIGDAAAIKKIMQEKIDYRLSRQPLDYPNIGSIFKNVPVELVSPEVLKDCADVIKQDPFPIVPAARLIGLAGLKRTARGGAMISEKHGNFIINTGGATAADVKYLIDLVKKKIKDKFGITLEEEVQLL